MSEWKLPEGWVHTKLEHVVTQIIGGGTPSKSIPEYYRGKIPWMTVKDLKRIALADTVDHISEEAVENSSANMIPAGTPVIATRMSLGKVALPSVDVAINQDLKAIFLASGVSEKFFVFWYRSIGKLVESMGAGSTVKGVRLDAVKGLGFPLPSIEEQEVVVDKLDEILAQVNNLKDRLDAIPAILKRFRKSVLAAAVSGGLTGGWRSENEVSETGPMLKDRWLRLREEQHGRSQEELIISGKQKKYRKFKKPVGLADGLELADVPETWCVVSVAEYAECLDSYRIPVKREKRARSEGLYPYFGANGEVDKVDEYIFDDDLVMVTEDETFYGREKPIAYRYTGKCWVNNHAHVLKAQTESANDYLCYALMHYNVLPWLSGTTGRAKLTQAALNSLPIALPPEEELNEIVRRVDQFLTFADQIERQVESAQARVNKLTQSILAKAFRGELTADWRATHPELISGEQSAEALLERIKAEKAAISPKKRARKGKVSA
ncbi:restriction endonuclease subunit S [Halomonas elongata]|uniref:restriction endonuclease subunit S n=1 Tax=Halomonas elongata TaxID=2746 RepID=UPI00335B7475